ncbi:hypothetical protein L218DRAFT_960528 [Marasmius fiardii PR-910]|nr:hypothetical protein L218DRAFT_960528 [Marasmius fiardii PR-910]
MNVYNVRGITVCEGYFNDVAGGQYNHNHYTDGAFPHPYPYKLFSLSSLFTALQSLWQVIAEVDATHDSEARYPLNGCHPNTREEILHLILEWVREPDSLVLASWISRYR